MSDTQKFKVIIAGSRDYNNYHDLEAYCLIIKR